LTTFLQVVLDGVQAGMLYALIAAGLCLVWGVMDVLNFAHGEFLMVSMYGSFWMGFLWKLDPLVSWIACAAFAFLLGVVVYKLVVARCIGGKSAMAVLLATFGLSMLLKNLCMNQFSPNFRLLSGTALEGKTVAIGGVIISAPQVATSLFSVAVVFALYWFVKRTRFGWAIQATSLEREAAELVGIDTQRVFLLVFGLGAACLGVAGGLLPSYLATHPDVGTMFGLLSFVVVALGGFGSIPGTFAAAILVGLVEALAGFYVAPVFKYVAVFSLYLAVIMVRPKGLFGW
jgi:branched-chain amino acid transport system permease protein